VTVNDKVSSPPLCFMLLHDDPLNYVVVFQKYTVEQT
jgi:hypothetical protein